MNRTVGRSGIVLRMNTWMNHWGAVKAILLKRASSLYGNVGFHGRVSPLHSLSGLLVDDAPN